MSVILICCNPLSLKNGAEGGLFGAVSDRTDAWFGVDGYPAKIVRIRLGLGMGSIQVPPSAFFFSFSVHSAEVKNSGGGAGFLSPEDLDPMREVSRLTFAPEEERLWCIVAETRDPESPSWFAYVGVGNPQGRLIKVDLLSMTRIGYVDLAGQDIRTGIVLGGHAYFVTSTKPATVLRCPTKAPSHPPPSARVPLEIDSPFRTPS